MCLKIKINSYLNKAKRLQDLYERFSLLAPHFNRADDISENSAYADAKVIYHKEHINDFKGVLENFPKENLVDGFLVNGNVFVPTRKLAEDKAFYIVNKGPDITPVAPVIGKSVRGLQTNHDKIFPEYDYRLSCSWYVSVHGYLIEVSVTFKHGSFLDYFERNIRYQGGHANYFNLKD